MSRNWRDRSSGFWDEAGQRRLRAGVIAGLGAALAIGAMEFLSVTLTYPLAVIPFATSIVLVIGLPEATPAQPRALIGGHLVATLIGLMVVHAVGPQPWAAALAVGLAVLA
ncbi:MAG: HPP family protein, partial [Aquamicrobium sp.]|nr:HPP family protein [Aquamicrobium sp.]